MKLFFPGSDVVPRAKKPVPPARERWAVGTLDEIRGRLNDFVNAKYEGNWTQFAEAMGLTAASVEPWKLAGAGWPSPSGGLARLRIAPARLARPNFAPAS